MNRELTVVVGGLPGLAERLYTTGQFAAVHETHSVGGFRDLVRGPLKGVQRDDVVLLFADNLTDDVPEMNFDRILASLAHWKVLIVGRSPNATRLVQRHPHVGLIMSPLTLNFVLAAISGLPGVPVLNPVGSGDDPLDFDAPQGVVEASVTDATVQAAATPAWTAVAPAARQDELGGNQTTTATSTPGTVHQLEVDHPASTSTAPAWAPIADTAPVNANNVEAAWNRESPVTDPWAGVTPHVADNPPSEIVPQQLETPDAWAQAAVDHATSPAGGALRPPSGLRRPAATANWSTGNDGPALRGGERARVAPQGPQRRGWVITVTAPKGGVGKSSFSLNMAVSLALRLKAQGKTVCLVDANFQQADIAKYLDLFNAPTVVDLARDRTLRSRDRIVGALAHVSQFNLYCLLGPSSTIEADPSFINARLYNELIVPLRELFDYVIIDTPVAERYHDIHAEFAIPAADFIVVPAIPSYQTLLNINRWLRETVVAPASAGGMGITSDKVGVVLNRAEDDVDCTEEDVQNELGSWKFLGAIPESKEWKRANNRNQVVAAANFPDLNEALRRILYAATYDYGHNIDEPALRPAQDAPASKKGGLFGLRRKRGN